MKKLMIAAAAMVLVCVVGLLLLRVTADARTEDARRTLEGSAKRFVTCYERERSYRTCETGSSDVAVTYRSRRAFSLTMSIAFVTTYTITRDADGELERWCQPRGRHCPVDRWEPGGAV